MTAPLPSDVGELLSTVSTLSSKLTGREGAVIREHLQQLAAILTRQGPDEELRALAAAELEQLIASLVRLTGLRGPIAKAIRGFEVRKLADGLRTFADYLRAPTSENQAQVEQLVAGLQGSAALQPVPLDELQIDQRVESLAVQSALRHGLKGAEARRAVERMKREMATLVRQLELRAQEEGHRANTANEMEQLLDALIATGNSLGQAIAPERDAIAAAFRRVDLERMANGLRVFAAWVSTPAADAVAHVAGLRAQLVDTLGPPTAADPGRSEADRRADFEREIEIAVDHIFRGTRPS
jgi:hypothetical protein